MSSEEDQPVKIEIPEPLPSPTPEQRALKRKRAIKQRLWIYGILFTVIYGGVWYQPYEVDWIPRRIPNPNPPVNPDTSRLFAKGTKVLVVTAHPDDSEFFIGGLLSQLAKSGANLHQVICTDGDKGYYFFFTNAAKNRVVRRQEARNAAKAWHAQSLKFLGYPDRFLHANDEVIAKISDEIEQFKPEYILAFDGDYPPRASHQDHRRSGDATKIAAQKTHIAKWLLLFSTIAPNYIVDITNQWEDQKNLLAIHRSQFFGSHLEGVENMVEYSAELDGTRGGFELGEGFRCIQIK
jgi:LmbE family N-acetylglucosaminyl deacetylase